MKIVIGIVLALFVFLPKAYAVIAYGNGEYTNLCGTGMNATADTCLRGCSVVNGYCSFSDPTVIKSWCDGRMAECTSNESTPATTQSLGNTPCGKTVQIDVFTKVCRINGEWVCSERDLVDYMVWYSGDCGVNPTVTPTVTPTPEPTSATPTNTGTITPTPAPAGSCTDIKVVSGNNAYVPATVQLSITGTGNPTWRVYFGDGLQKDTKESQLSHKYETSGTFQVSAAVLDDQGNVKSNSSCKTTVTVRTAVPLIESQQSACSNVLITEGEGAFAPTTAKFTVTGRDNKGSIQQYKIDFGDGTQEESTQSAFQKFYPAAGTFVIKGYIYDSSNKWKGGDKYCKVSLHIVNGTPMKNQPETGTPTWFTVLALASGAFSLGLFTFRTPLIKKLEA